MAIKLWLVRGKPLPSPVIRYIQERSILDEETSDWFAELWSKDAFDEAFDTMCKATSQQDERNYDDEQTLIATWIRPGCC